MKYMGSKARIRNQILPIILENRREGQCYVEPFVGGCNTIEHVNGRRIGADNNYYLIAFLKGIQDGLKIPYPISKNLYDQARNEMREGKGVLSDFEVGAIGFMASFNGRFFDGGYNGNDIFRDYTLEGIKNIEKSTANIRCIELLHCDYRDLNIPHGSIVYCDPPYAGTKQYSTSKNFIHDEFWEWCRGVKIDGHTIYISEYSAPPDFECVWRMPIKNTMSLNRTIETTEKLFTF